MGRCIRHGAMCPIFATEIHRSSTPCQDVSALGTGGGVLGPRCAVFLAWVAICKTLKYKIIFHESVEGFGDSIFQQLM
eukprot:13751499-Alexandrium_andersonii.AAC.1